MRFYSYCRKTAPALALLCFFLLFCASASAQTGHWEKLEPIDSPPGRTEHAMAPAGEGKVLMFGGKVSNEHLNDLWLFDYDRNTWIELQTELKPPKRSAHAFCNLNDDVFLLFGGDSGGPYLGDTWIFDLKDTSWTELKLEESPDPRMHHGLAKITENNALLFGGRNFNGHFLSDTWIFDYDKKKWTIIETSSSSIPFPKKRENVRITNLSDGLVFLYGGWSFEQLNDTWLFNFSSNEWEEIQSENEIPKKTRHSICNLDDENILVFGGDTDGKWYTDYTGIYDVKNSLWISLDSINKPEGRSYSEMSHLANGKAILFGGVNYYVLGDTWLFLLYTSSYRIDKQTMDYIENVYINNSEICVTYYISDYKNTKFEIIDVFGNILLSCQ